MAQGSGRSDGPGLEAGVARRRALNGRSYPAQEGDDSGVDSRVVNLLRDHWEGATVDHAVDPVDGGTSWPDLAGRIQQGNPEAESELARQFHHRVLMAASVRLHGSDAAADIAQETILAVLEALRRGRVREPDRLPAFVLGIVRNLINNHCRKQSRNRELQIDQLREPAGAEPREVGLGEERRAQVRRALKHLNPLDRRILLLTLVDGMPPRVIAPIVGLTPELVRTRKSRAVKAVGDAVGARHEQDGSTT
jgi:RNA polymerase sigma factor (sigma-70 family)